MRSLFQSLLFFHLNRGMTIYGKKAPLNALKWLGFL